MAASTSNAIHGTDYTDADLIDVEEDTQPIGLCVYVHIGLADFMPSMPSGLSGAERARLIEPILQAAERFGDVLENALYAAGVDAFLTYNAYSRVGVAVSPCDRVTVGTFAPYTDAISRHTTAFRVSLSDWYLAHTSGAK